MSEAGFTLHPRLAADCGHVCDLALSCVLLMNDSRYPWLIAVPRRAGITGIDLLQAVDRAVLMEEIAALSARLRTRYHPDRINVGALGNMVPQLHVHVIARKAGDAAWPGPVWGAGAAVPYPDIDAAVRTMRDLLGI